MDLQRLLEMAADDPKQMRGFADQYLTQAEDLMGNLRAAVRVGSAREVSQLAHKLGGSSSTCGMTGIVAPLLEIERASEAGQGPENEQRLLEAGRQLDLMRTYLAEHVPAP